MDSHGCQARTIAGNLELDCTSTFGLLDELLARTKMSTRSGNLPHLLDEHLCSPSLSRLYFPLSFLIVIYRLRRTRLAPLTSKTGLSFFIKHAFYAAMIGIAL